jgi:isopenicillin N synthase-like dioxygenase
MIMFMQRQRQADGVPAIDLSPFLCGADRAGVVAAVRGACERLGFFVVRGHNVPPACIGAATSAAMCFFQLPEPAKRRVLPMQAGASRGYAAIGSMSLGQSQGDTAPPDFREAFRIGRLDDGRTDTVEPDRGAESLCAANVWPAESEVPGFRKSFEDAYRALESLSATLMRIFALTLNLPENYFEDKIDRHVSALAAYHYPPLPGSPMPGTIRGGAHTDFGSLTLVHGHPSISGLQVWSGGRWLDVPAVPDSFVVNLGDLMAQWTNDLWVSTLHRVVSRDESDWVRSRYSLVFFHQPNDECVIHSLDPHLPAKYAPITSGEHFRRKMSAMRVSQPPRDRGTLSVD